jgi:hypothetical protein
VTPSMRKWMTTYYVTPNLCISFYPDNVNPHAINLLLLYIQHILTLIKWLIFFPCNSASIIFKVITRVGGLQIRGFVAGDGTVLYEYIYIRI